jgi:biotin operon repressor
MENKNELHGREEKEQQEFSAASDNSNLEEEDFPEIISARSLIHSGYEKPKMRIENLLPEAGLIMLVGDPKIGKSKFMRSIIIDLSLARNPYGFSVSEATGAAYFAYEEGKSSIKDQLIKMLENRKLSPDTHPQIDFIWNVHNLKIGEGLEDFILDYLDKNWETKVVVLDPIAGCVPQSLSRNYNYFKDYSIVGSLQNLALEQKISIVFIHHSRKAESEKFLDIVSGTRGMVGPCSVNWFLFRSQFTNKGKLIVMGREMVLKTYELEFNEQLIEWDFLGETFNLGISQTEIDFVEAIYENQEDGIRNSDLAIKLDTTKSNVSHYIHKLREKGIVSKYQNKFYLTDSIFNKMKKIKKTKI